MTVKFGQLFPEMISGEKYRRKFNFAPGRNADYGLRITIFLFLLCLSLGILAARLFTLAIIEGANFRSLSQSNRIRETKILAPRGIIYDRSGTPLVRNIPLFRVNQNGHEQIFVGDPPPATVSGQIEESLTRDYIYGGDLSHLLGYIGEIDGKELSHLNEEITTLNLYHPGDLVGKSGIEQSFEQTLRGIDGKELSEVDATGVKVRELGRIEPKAGGNVYLSLDLSLQKKVAALMQNKKGAVVVSNPVTGEILAFYSSPAFDPNNFMTKENITQMLNSPDKPLFDRVISGVYPPGSTFKIVTAIAGLETGVINSETKFEDVGVLEVGPFKFPNWYFLQYGKKEGMVDVVTALKRSNDIFFYRAGEALGIERLTTWEKKLGLGKPLGIDIEGEASGVVPDTAWKKKVRNEPWYLGDTYHLAIGQGDLLVTPLQVNSWTNVVASGGKLCRPTVTKIQSYTCPSSLHSDICRQEDSKLQRQVMSNECKDLGLKKEDIELVKQGMRAACSVAPPEGGVGGTGWPLFSFKVQSEKLKVDGVDFLQTTEATMSGKPIVEIKTACKTGTAEYGDPQGKTHAWFTVFAPAGKPQLSVTVLVEGGGEGSNVGGPIAKEILNEWFAR